MQYLRYVWSALLLAAAILAPDPATTITLLVGGLLTIGLAVSREKFLQKLMHELNESLPFRAPTMSSALERSLLTTQKRLLGLAVGAEMIIFIAMLANQLDITVARNYALLVLVALAPLGLELTLGVLIRLKHHRSSETVRTAVGYAVEDAYTLLAVVGLSLAGTLIFNIPPALSALQILLISCVVRPLLSGRALQATQHKADRAWRVLFASIIVYGSFVFFFIRHYLEPSHADMTNPVTWQATTVALLSFVACQIAWLLFNPSAPKSMVYRSFTAWLLLVLVAYLDPLQQFFMTVGPDAADWIAILVTGPLFMTLILFRQRSSLRR